MKPTSKFLIYLRVSTKGQGDSGLGLEAQRAYLAHFLSAESVVCTVTEIESAKNIEDRPGLQRAIERCKAEGLTLAVAKLDRLSRRTEDALAILSDLDGRLFACDIPTQPGERMDKFMLTIIMAVADRERELIGIRTKQALAAKKARDGSVHPVRGHRNNFTAEGCAKSIATKRAKAAESDQKVRLVIRALREQNRTLDEIAGALNREGFRTPHGQLFGKMTVKRILDRS